jgi:hypothetical protein
MFEASGGGGGQFPHKMGIGSHHIVEMNVERGWYVIRSAKLKNKDRMAFLKIVIVNGVQSSFCHNGSGASEQIGLLLHTLGNL